MKFVFVKVETSERSNKDNWVKSQIIASGKYHLDCIEGCSQDKSNKTTHLMDRALVEIIDDGDDKLPTGAEALELIRQIQGEESLERKLRFALHINAEYDYILYTYRPERIIFFRYHVKSLTECIFCEQFNDASSFSKWLDEIKQWKSNKSYEKIEDLPRIDLELRKNKCAWPANIDAMVTDSSGRMRAIIEFQNTTIDTVRNHSNLTYFYPTEDKDTKKKKMKDYRRWQTCELVRLASGLPTLIITWHSLSGETNEDNMVCRIRQLNFVCFPKMPPRNKDKEDNPERKEYMDELYGYYNGYINAKPGYREYGKKVLKTRESFTYKVSKVQKLTTTIRREFYKPPLRYSLNKFPYMYLSEPIEANKDNVAHVFDEFLTSISDGKNK